MSEPKLVSPLLDNFLIGNAISQHGGVSTYPAMRNDSDEKYIVKIILIPASDVQLQAMLLSGAYATREEAIAYFARLAKDAEQEAATLSMLSKLEGFLPYEGIQTVAREDGSGFDIYILTTYKKSLQRHFRKYPMTHLAAINLGLDMCASLAVSRQKGYIYANLKPSNIFISDDQEYRIGDIGFLKMDGLKYATLPERYRSPYLAPELADPFAEITPTIDIYAAGLILYQAYNGGELPFDAVAPQEPLPAPLYADYEMAEIILKACAPDPKDRWSDPIKMGQAIVSYMQRNGANDTPIIPVVPEEAPVEDAAAAQPAFDEETAEDKGNIYEQANETGQMMIETMIDYDAIMAIQAEIENGSTDEPAEAEIPSDTNEATAELPTPEAIPEEAAVPEMEAASAVCILSDICEEAPAAEPETALSADVNAVPAEVITEEAALDEPAAEEDKEYSFLDDLVDDETAPDEETAEPVDYDELPDDLTSILAQVDDLIAHETPAPAVAPDPIEIPMPEPIVPDSQKQSSDQEDSDDPIGETVAAIDEAMATSTDGRLDKDLTNDMQIDNDEQPASPAEEPYPEDGEPPKKKNVLNKILTAVLVLIIISCLVVVGILFYRDYYLKTIEEFNVTGHEDTMQVEVKTDADENLILVVCTGEYGNRHTARLENGVASFSDLSPKTQYTVTLEIDGFHGLSGKTTAKYTTEACTEITGLSTVVGADSASAILTFAVKGDNLSKWKVHIVSADEPKRTEEFTGNTANITGLTPGNTYEFTVEPYEGGYVIGQSKIIHKAVDVIVPQNLAVQSCNNEGLVVTWEAPEGASVNSWKVHCSSASDNSYNQSMNVTETTATFTDIDPAGSYNIEVTAEGMSVFSRFYLTENAVTASNIQKELVNGDLRLSWTPVGDAPASGWVVTYTINDETTSHITNADGTAAVLDNVIPGAAYHISIQLADGRTVVGGTFEYDVPEAEKFAGYGVTADNMTLKMCLVPNVANWNIWYVKSFKDQFKADEKAGFTMQLNQRYQVSNDIIDILFVFRDAENRIVSYNVTSQTWTSMWYQYNGELELLSLPTAPGEYTVEIYLNGGFIHKQAFTVTE